MPLGEVALNDSPAQGIGRLPRRLSCLLQFSGSRRSEPPVLVVKSPVCPVCGLASLGTCGPSEIRPRNTIPGNSLTAA